jgi:riboflavin transporter FmnP
MNKRLSTKSMVTYAMLSAVAYVAILLTRFQLVPAADFLKYDPKDVVVVISGFLYGPLPALAVNVVASFVEMISIGTSGPIGMLMTVLATASFSTPAVIIYRRKRDLTSAVVGLLVGSVTMVAFMLLWNYIMVPIYQGIPRAAVAGMLVPVFLPFNAIKAAFNASVTMLLYKPVVGALRASGLYKAEGKSAKAGKFNWGVVAISLVIFVSLSIFTLVTVNPYGINGSWSDASGLNGYSFNANGVTRVIDGAEAEGTYSVNDGHMEIQWDGGGSETLTFEKAGGAVTIDGITLTKN